MTNTNRAEFNGRTISNLSPVAQSLAAKHEARIRATEPDVMHFRYTSTGGRETLCGLSTSQVASSPFMVSFLRREDRCETCAAAVMGEA